MHAGKVNSVVFDKKLGILMMAETSIFCKAKTSSYNLGEVQGVSVVKKGHEGINFYTLHFVI
jgi:hypothetical protein